MCGICGAIAFDRDELLGEDVALDASVAAMARRGPDGEGTFAAGPCVLGFRRLSILDPTPASDQPMSTADGRFTLVYNGELYNFHQVRRDLEGVGRAFRTRGDTEVVLTALAEWGRDAFARFDGMYALALYDRDERRLLLARDHAGIKPLYVSLTPQGAVFGSQFDQILMSPWTRDLGLSEDGLALYLRFGYITPRYSILRSTTMLEPGAWLSIDSGGHVEEGRSSSFDAFRSVAAPDLDLDRRADDAVGEAVRAQLVSDVPLGAFLSGGIDSPLIASKMRAAEVDEIRAFTISSPNDPSDESADAIAYAKELNVRHVLRRAEAEEALALVDDAVAACGEPFADYSIIPTMLVAEVARRDVKVILSGDGGDELFWGYVDRFGEVLTRARAFRMPYALRSARRGIAKTTRLVSGHPSLRWRTIGHWYLGKHSHLDDARLRAILPDLPPLPHDFDVYEYDGWRDDETAAWLRWNEMQAHLHMCLLKVDRASMYNSLEVRVPLLGRAVIDVAERANWRDCLDLDRRLGKLPLRHSLANHVRHQSSEKRGFEIPMGRWLRNELRPLVEDVLLDRNELLGMPFDRAAARRLYDSHLTERSDRANAIWTLLSLALWEKKHLRPARSSASESASNARSR